MQVNGQWGKAGSLAIRGRSRFWSSVVVTRDRRVADFGVNLLVWSSGEDEPWLVISSAHDPARIEAIYRQRFWIEEMFSDQKSRGLNLEATRLTDPDRLQRLLVAVTLAYLWIMEVGALGVARGWWRQVDNRGAQRTVSLCQIGLRWLSDRLNQDLAPPSLLSPWRNHEKNDPQSRQLILPILGNCIAPPDRSHEGRGDKYQRPNYSYRQQGWFAGTVLHVGGT